MVASRISGNSRRLLWGGPLDASVLIGALSVLLFHVAPARGAAASGGPTSAKKESAMIPSKPGEPKAVQNAPTASVKAASRRNESVRPFHFHASDEQLADLHPRIAATRWPDKETVADASQGVQLATMQALAKYWGTEYDWRKCEAKLNALPQFVTNIDGLDIHFIHVRSPHDNALPLIVTHGWPGSIYRAAEDHRAADQSDGTWRLRVGCAHAAGRNGRIRTSSITTGSTKAGISRPGSSRNSSAKKSARASDPCVNRRGGTTGTPCACRPAPQKKRWTRWPFYQRSY